jgi:cytochrome c553
MKNIITAIAGAAALALSMHAMAGGDMEAGKAVVTKYACNNCHGADLQSPTAPDYPKLAGQLPDYISHALVSYRRGNEGANANGRVQPVMGAIAKQMNDKEISDVAAYIGSLPGSLVTVTESKFIKH